MRYSEFEKILNQTLFENSYSVLFEKLSKSPERYIGIFRPTKPKTKIIQNITQSHEIRFGDALENIIEQYLKELGYKIHDKHINHADGEKYYDIDQLFSSNNTLYLIEQKVRDDHDSTKKLGQFDNFEGKYYEVFKLYGNKFEKIVPIMWFIDDCLTKNKHYYLVTMQSMSADYGCEPLLFYGDKIFKENGGIDVLPISMWEEIINFLKQWKSSLPDMPEVNFDLNADEVYEELKDLEPLIFRKILNNEGVVKEIFPVIFPDAKVLDLLYNDFKERNEKVYNSISTLIENAKKQYLNN